MRLHDAIKSGNAAQVEDLLASGVDVNLPDSHGFIPLEIAISCTNLEMVMVLLDNGADVNAITARGSILHHAVTHDNVKIVMTLLEKGANVNTITHHGSVLHEAVKHDNVEIVRTLLERGADVNATSSFHDSVLHIAAMHDNVEIVRTLLERGANVNAITHNGSVLYQAVIHDNVEIMKTLLEMGANVNATFSYHSSALYRAVLKSSIGVVRALLDNGADVNSRHRGEIPLQGAFRLRRMDVFMLLLKYHADTTRLGNNNDQDRSGFDPVDRSGWTPLHIAAADGGISTVYDLLVDGVDVLAKTPSGETALEIALSHHHPSVVRILLERNWPSFDAKGPIFSDEVIEQLFEPRRIDNFSHGIRILDHDLPPKLDGDFHQPRCAHRILGSASNLESSPGDQGFETPFSSPADSDFAEHTSKLDGLELEVAYLCGLGGVLPLGIDEGGSCGFVNIRKDTGQVMYGTNIHLTNAPGVRNTLRRPFSKLEIDKLLKDCTNVTTRVIYAARRLQHGGFCCNNFTILVLPPGATAIKVVPISIGLVEDLFATLAVGTSGQAVDFARIQAFSEQIFEEFEFAAIIRTKGEVETILHECSLALQVLAFGLVNYIRCHSVELNSHWITATAPRWMLCGTGITGSRIQVEEKKLACLHGMINSTVLVFRGYPRRSSDSFPHSSDKTPAAPCGEFLRTTIIDFIDTWGRSILYASSTSSGEYYAADICGGIIVPEKEQPLKGQVLCHWEEGLDLHDTPKDRPLFRSSDVLVIGFTKVNKQCQLDQRCLTSALQACLYNVGTENPHMSLSQVQVGAHGGHYGILQFAGVWKRHPGSTLKRAIMQDWNKRDLEILYMPVGLELSICTGIARRVLLKDIFNVPGVQEHIRYVFDEEWELLTAPSNSWNALFESKSRAEFRDAARKLKKDTKIHDRFAKIVCHVLKILQHTGVDSQCRNIQFWWPEEEPQPRGIKIPRKSCGIRGRPWIRMLRDSPECAVFAVASTTCVQSNPLKMCCQRPTPQIPLHITVLETSLVRVGGPNTSSVISQLVVPQPILQSGQKYLMGNAGVLVAQSQSDQQHPPLQLRWEDSVLPPFPATNRVLVREIQRCSDQGQGVFVL
ncbi:hypothetical protein EMPG_15338 [Blastomyces silverae]|uniref:Uncharacterized protein n=1 Tax=Blastomyces silverae TaxID=2060906 RepID=A0A0H1BCY5_9EURO|nr:hypothetical protein EMPG_15338 [Blastomyces silverae]